MTKENHRIHLNYQQQGSGTPLILLHGNGEDHTIFHELIKQLSQKYEVFALDSRGHGNSTPVTEFHYHDMAEDVINFIHDQQISKPIIYGFSDGGIIALLIAVKEPELLAKIIISGANANPWGLKWRWHSNYLFQYWFNSTPLISLMIREPHITKKMLRQIKTPTMIIAGEKDIIRSAHTRYLHHNINHSKLLIIPNENHSSYVLDNEKLFKILNALLNQ
ncbi:2-succinyl-6-hydroxy-2,4-cyclohexadiene-1-carboxylate synthase [bioreactor metagenome]|uniref:2-succinyl-6-hydroxy-2, 4-cyclohexadiene-1-carboxylate synthase n=1 Tax=bioreactor metagenome TaxID=1076179 RepID=A0A645B7N3_9ZZZZ|nr:alpha/beta hydrolase [Erysipelotrichaceae bacterium]